MLWLFILCMFILFFTLILSFYTLFFLKLYKFYLFFIRHGTFASGGGDGTVSIWDGFHKKRLKQYDPCPTSISAINFNSDGTKLVVASSYTFEQCEKE